MHTPQHKRPLWLGALFASLAPPACLIVLMGLSNAGHPSLAGVRTGTVAFLMAFAVAAVAMLLLGLPFVLWLRSRSALNPALICAGAAVIGSITFALLIWLPGWDHELEPAHLLYGAGFGLIAGIAFCAGTGSGRIGYGRRGSGGA